MKTLLSILFAALATGALAWQQYGGSMSSSPDFASASVQPTSAQVTIYTIQGCPYCQRTIAYLDEIGQRYVNRDIERDEGAYADYMSLTGGNPGVPVIDVGGRVMQGWNQAQLNTLLLEAP